MLSKILSKNQCASCKFCCSFKESSLWELPVFNENIYLKIKEKYPSLSFKKLSPGFYTLDFSNLYQHKSPLEEAPCPFLDKNTGCLLPEDLKPFDCKIWPFRIMKNNEKIGLALSKQCPWVKNTNLKSIIDFLNKELAQKLINYSKENPNSIKEYNSNYYFWEI